MKPSLPKRLGAALLRTVLLFLTFHLTFFVANACFMSIIGRDESMLSPRAVAAWLFALQMLLFESTVFAFHRHRPRPHDGDSSPGSLLRDTFLSVEFWMECAGITLLSCLLPSRYDSAGIAFFGESFAKGSVLLVILPVLLLLEIAAHLSVGRARAADRLKAKSDKKEPPPLIKTIKSVALVAGIYCAAALILSWYMPLLVTLKNMGKPSAVLYVTAAVLAAILLTLGFYFIRAMKKRKDFIGKLQKHCRTRGIILSKIRNPSGSVFLQQKGTDFTLRHNGQTYACKFVAGVFPASPMIFADTGEGIRQDTLRLFRTDLLHLNTRLNFRMEDCPPGSRKLVIVLPVPQRIYASVHGAPPRPADTGEVLGDYTLYTATGFLGALEREHL